VPQKLGSKGSGENRQIKNSKRQATKNWGLDGSNKPSQNKTKD